MERSEQISEYNTPEKLLIPNILKKNAIGYMIINLNVLGYDG
jgi:hypothetical protein